MSRVHSVCGAALQDRHFFEGTGLLLVGQDFYER
jgi:hypothetical protein